MLSVLTVIDIKSVGPGIWNDWKATLLRALYIGTKNYLEGREDLAPAAKAASLREQMQERLPEGMAASISPITDQLPNNYWLNFSMAKLVMQARFFETLLKSGHDVSSDSATKTRVNPRRNVTELWVMTRDRPGLFRDLCLAITASGASIAGAHLNTGKNGLVMNVFYLNNKDGNAFASDSDHALDNLRQLSLKAAKGQTDGLIIPRSVKSRRAGAIPVKRRVKFEDTTQGQTTIIEVQGRDRPGLLYELARYLTEQGFNIASAHIENVGAMAVDAFYLQGQTLDKARKKEIRAGLLPLLGSAPSNKKAA